MDKLTVKKKEFPSWAPKSLIQWHEMCLMKWHVPPESEPQELNMVISTSSGHDKWQITFLPLELPKNETAELVYRWATDARMEDAWKRIKGFEGDLADDAAYFVCKIAVAFLAQFRSTPRMTKNEKKEHFSKIAVKADELAALLNGCVEFRKSDFSEYLSDQQTSNLAHSIANVSFGSGTDFNAAATRGQCNLESTRSVFSLPTCAPTVPNLLAQLAAKAKSEEGKPPLAAHPSGRAAEIKFLTVQLSKLMAAANWKTPNLTTDVIVRAFVRAAYPKVDITDERVRTARRRAAS
jgi:hypothetical protein